MPRQLKIAALALLLLLAAGNPDSARVEGQSPKAISKMMYVLPSYLVGSGDFAADVASLRQRFGEGKYVRVGFSYFVFISMSDWNVNVSDRAAIRSALASTIAQFDSLLTAARTNNIPIHFLIQTPVRSRYDPVQFEAERADRRNTSWYMDGQMANGWITFSRYARRLRGVYEPYVREVGSILANRMAKYPGTLVSSSGDGETEMSYDRSPIVNPAYTEATTQLCDYSPFAIAEFRDWLRSGGLYAQGQPFAGQGYDQAARYQGDATPGTDTNGDGHTLNGDFGTSFTSWSLKHFDWSLNDPVTNDPNAIASFVYEGSEFNPLPAQIPTGFDAPRVRVRGNPWWETWDFFRQVMVWRYNIDFARWITTTVDTDTKMTVPAARWFSHQLPADYLFGSSPANPNFRLVTSAGPHWVADISPYGGVGITSFNVNLGGGRYAYTGRNVIPEIAARGVRWVITEWNPSIPVSNSLDVYDEEMALIERYRPTAVMPFGWGHPVTQVINTPFETALRDMIARIKDTPAPPPPSLRLDFGPRFLKPGEKVDPRPLGAYWPIRRPDRDRDRNRDR